MSSLRKTGGSKIPLSFVSVYELKLNGNGELSPQIYCHPYLTSDFKNVLSDIIVKYIKNSAFKIIFLALEVKCKLSSNLKVLLIQFSSF
jgi:hypothetical protein